LKCVIPIIVNAVISAISSQSVDRIEYVCASGDKSSRVLFVNPNSVKRIDLNPMVIRGFPKCVSGKSDSSAYCDPR